MKRVRTPKRTDHSWVTGKEVAAAANVSLITVSRAFTTPERVAPETLKRVREVSQRLGYIPNAVAGDLASRRSRVVAAVVPTLSHSNFAQTIEGLVTGLRRERYELLLSSSAFSIDREQEIVSTFMERRPDAIVLVGNDHAPELRRLLKTTRIPVMELWALDGPIVDMAVGFSDVSAMKELTRHVISTGRTRIGYIDFHRTNVRRYLDRCAGFTAALNEAGLAADLVARSPTPKDYESGRQCLAALLAQEPNLDAVIGCTDIHAAGAIFECFKRSISVPDQLSVAGFGNFEIAAATEPPLSTVSSHAYEMGLRASEMIINRMRGEDVPQAPLDVGFELVIRQST